MMEIYCIGTSWEPTRQRIRGRDLEAALGPLAWEALRRWIRHRALDRAPERGGTVGPLGFDSPPLLAEVDASAQMKNQRIMIGQGQVYLNVEIQLI